MNNNDWIKENVKIFLDENINSCVKDNLLKKGFNVFDVSDIAYKGVSDNELLAILRKEKMILVTHDYRFVKMARKYNRFAILITTTGKNEYRSTSINGIVINELQKYYKELREYYLTGTEVKSVSLENIHFTP